MCPMNDAAIKTAFAAALNTVRASNAGEIPGRRSDVTVDGILVRVYGAGAMRTRTEIQAVADGQQYTATVGKGDRLGKLTVCRAI